MGYLMRTLVGSNEGLGETQTKNHNSGKAS
ncbi:hypothetical protein RDI58_017451 [Solanum bulbocastanum]|uniref:Uncharacterized protein n=1 Tax=Solanum bulbocastanum TaxID=147425 RepID=A0AAN8TFI0_SOLBU